MQGLLKIRRLSRTMADLGLDHFRRPLAYQSQLAASTLQVVSRCSPSSKTCSGWIDQQHALSDRPFICTSCALVLERDLHSPLH